MKKRALHWNVVEDDGGQALTEFAVVIPIVLLMFFAILQYFYVVRASQLGNYAAFTAARSYAVLHDEQDARLAAAMALAPIGRPVPGEPLAFLSGGPMKIGKLNDLLNQNVQYAGNYIQGLGYVYALRLQPDLLGGSVNVSTGGKPQQVNVAINYPQPVFVPGLAELWNLVAGERIYHKLEPLSEGLTGVPGKALPILSDVDQAQEILKRFGRQPRNLPFIIYPYINVRSKCSVGYEDWSGNLRMRSSDTSLDNFLDPSQSGSALNGLDSLGQSAKGLLPSLISLPFPH